MGKASDNVRNGANKRRKKVLAKNRNKYKEKNTSSGTGESGAPDDTTTGTPENFDDKQQPKVTNPAHNAEPRIPNKEYRRNGAADSEGIDIDNPNNVENSEENNEINVESANGEKEIDVHTAATSMSQANPTQQTTNTTPPVGGKVTGIPNPDDEQKQDDEKFDIQQGDFIDFLMKDVVLAAVAWSGKRVSNILDFSLYKISSASYHKVKEWAVELNNARKENKEKRREHRQHIRECAENGCITNDHIEKAKKAHNTETAEILELHNQEMKNVYRKLNSGEVYSRFIEELMETSNNAFFEKCNQNENGDFYWKDKETGHEILIKSNNPNSVVDKYANEFICLREDMNKPLEELSEERRRQFESIGLTELPVPEAIRDDVFKGIAASWAIMFEEQATMDAESDTFAYNMATAQMLKDGAGKEDREAYKSLYKAQYLSLIKQLRQGKQLNGIKSTEKLLELSQKAKDLTVTQNEEKDGLKKDNEYLDTINKAIKANNEIQDDDCLISLSQEASNASKKIKKLSDDQKKYNETISLATQNQQTYKDEKAKLKAVRARLDLNNPRDNASTEQDQKNIEGLQRTKIKDAITGRD